MVNAIDSEEHAPTMQYETGDAMNVTNYKICKKERGHAD